MPHSVEHYGIPWGKTPAERRAYYREYCKAYRQRYPEKWKTAKLKWKLAHPEASRDSVRVGAWKHKGINITISEYKMLLEKQQNCCAICQEPDNKLAIRLAVDHNHATGKIRGLLCGKCNANVLSVVEHYRHLIPVAIKYLEENDHVSI